MGDYNETLGIIVAFMSYRMGGEHLLQETSRWMQALRGLFVNDCSQTYDGDELDSHERLAKQVVAFMERQAGRCRMTPRRRNAGWGSVAGMNCSLACLGLLLALLMGCEGETPTPVSHPSPTPMATAKPTHSPTPTPTLSPSPTVTATPMPAATATLFPTATPHPLPDAPDVPSLVSISPTEISVVWKEPASLAPISGYDYRYAEESSPWVEVVDSGLTDRGVTITGLSPSTVYRVQVRVVSERGHGDWSPTWLVQTSSVPTPTPTPTATPSLAQPHVMLRVVIVHDDKDGWRYYSPGGWAQAVVQKESEALRCYEAAIWEETSSVHLYAFPQRLRPVLRRIRRRASRGDHCLPRAVHPHRSLRPAGSLHRRAQPVPAGGVRIVRRFYWSPATPMRSTT